MVALPFKCLFLLAFCQVFLKLDLGLPHSPLPLPSSHVFSVAAVDPVQLWKENCRGGELTHVWGPPHMKGRENPQAPNSSGRWASGDCGKAKRSVFARVCKGSWELEVCWRDGNSRSVQAEVPVCCVLLCEGRAGLSTAA